MTGFINKIIESERYQVLLAYVKGLSPEEAKVIVFVIAFFLALLVFKKLGIRILAVLLFAYLFAYVIYYGNFIDKIVERETRNNAHMQMIQDTIVTP